MDLFIIFSISIIRLSLDRSSTTLPTTPARPQPNSRATFAPTVLKQPTSYTMPAFGLAHKPSRSKMRSVSADSITTAPTATPTSHSQRTGTQQHQPQPPISPAPMPIDSSLNTGSGSGSGSGFKMFNWKRKGSASSTGSAGSASHGDGASTGSKPYYPAEPPRPILKTAVSDQGPSTRGIRFAASAGGVWDAPVSTSPSVSLGPLASAPDIAIRGDANGRGGGGQPLFNRSAPSHHPSQGPGPGPGRGQGPPPQLHIQIHHANLERQSQTLESMGMSSPTRSVSRANSTSPRRSSRPASPSASSFGQRIRTESAPATTTMGPCSPRGGQNQPLPRRESRHSPNPSVMCTPPAFCPSHVTTPPVAYCSSMQSRAPPPPVPYRPTAIQDRSWSATTRVLPEELPMTREMAPRPPRHSSLFTNTATPRSSRPGSRPTSGASISALGGVDVPMLNIIPATPQELNDEFSAGASAGPSRRRVSEELGDAVQIHRMTEISLAETEGEGASEGISTEILLPKSDSTPAIQVELDFSPFSPTIDLALDDYITSNNFSSQQVESERVQAPVVQAPTTQESAQSSPPQDMDSYPSLPSLSSQTSITSGMSLRSSSSMSSVMTFPDVEEALGSMLASLSDGQISFPYDADMLTASGKSQQDHHDQQERERDQDEARNQPPSNPGLGLGLDFPQPSFITAPLSPRKSKPKPGRINTVLAQSVDLKSFDPTPGSAPPVINHRVAFYGTARAHPRSPSSGVFTRSLTDISNHCDESDPSSVGTSTAVTQAPSGLEVEVEETEMEATTPTLRSQIQSQSPFKNGMGMPDSLPSSSALSTASRDSVVSTMTMSSQGTTIGCRDSMSGHSESSDEDLHTASIINLTPVAVGPGRSFSTGAGAGAGGEMDIGMGMGMDMEMTDEEVMVDDVHVGLAL